MIHLAGKKLDPLPGLKYTARRLSTGFCVQPVHWSDDPVHDEAWADALSMQYGGRHAPAWLREMEMELVRGGTAVWPMLDREVHVSEHISFKELTSDAWTVYRGLDHGVRVPTCCAWAGVNRDGDRYLYRQYYQAETTIAQNARNIVRLTEPEEEVAATVADPSIWTRDPKTLEVLAAEYARNNLPLVQADNSRAGYDWLMRGFLSALCRWSIVHGYKPHKKLPQTLSKGDLEQGAAHPAIWFHPVCADGELSLFEQCRNLRWKEVKGDPLKRAAPEEYEDIHDEGPDVVRYLCQTPGVRWTRVQRAQPVGADMLFRKLREEAGAGKMPERLT